jgi:hypothetical protein
VSPCRCLERENHSITVASVKAGDVERLLVE